MEKWHPGYFGKKGIRTFHYNKNLHHCPVVNIDKLWSLVSEETRTKYANIKKGASEPNRQTVGGVTLEQVKEIAVIKMNDLNTDNIDKAILIIKGTAKSMGIIVN